MKSRIKEWLEDTWFWYVKCYIGVRKGDVFIIKTNDLTGCRIGDIVIIKRVWWGREMVFDGRDGEVYITRLQKCHFEKVRRLNESLLCKIKRCTELQEAILEYADDLRDIAESLRQQYEATRTIGYLYQAREMEEALRILKEYFPEVLK